MLCVMAATSSCSTQDEFTENGRQNQGGEVAAWNVQAAKEGDAHPANRGLVSGLERGVEMVKKLEKVRRHLLLRTGDGAGMKVGVTDDELSGADVQRTARQTGPFQSVVRAKNSFCL